MLRSGVGLIVVLTMAIVLGGSAAPAQAGCDGMVGYSCQHRQTLPGLTYVRSEAGHIYGAIAYSKRNGAFGWSTGFGDSESANDLAMEKCSARGPGCYVVISFSNLCASVSADNEGGVFWGTAGTRQEAQRLSQFYCTRDGDRNSCEIKAWACSIP